MLMGFGKPEHGEKKKYPCKLHTKKSRNRTPDFLAVEARILIVLSTVWPLRAPLGEF